MTTAFRTLLLEGIRKFAQGGAWSQGDLEEWMQRLHYVLDKELPTDEESREMLARILGSVFQRDLRTGLAKRIPGIERYTLDRIQPHLRAELDRRIFAGIDLIKLNRSAAIAKTLQRFSGWVSSVPPAGVSTSNLREIAREIAKPTAQLKFERRRVAIDQSAKLSSAISYVVAMGNGAIAAEWHDRGATDKSYDARPDHLRRTGKIYLIRNSWAQEQGLIKPGPAGYFDEITQPGEEIFCSCWARYISSPAGLPETMLTRKGREWTRLTA